MQKFFRLKSYCTVSQGYNRSILIHLKSKQYWFIPNIWAQIISKSTPSKITSLFVQLPHFSEKEIYSFLFFLQSIDTLDFSDFKDSFDPIKQIPLSDLLHHKLRSISVEVNPTITFLPFLQKFDLTGITCQLYFKSISHINDVLSNYNDSDFHALEIFVDAKVVANYNLNMLLNRFNKIRLIQVNNSKETRKSVFRNSQIHWVSDVLHFNEFVISAFNTNFHTSVHTQFYNTLHITLNGTITNQGIIGFDFGNILNTTLNEVIENVQFKAIGVASKTKVDVCVDCEFKAICIDKRPLKRRKKSNWYSLIECNYNPYISKFNNEEGYINLADCGIESSGVGFSIQIGHFIDVKSKIWQEKHWLNYN